MKIKSIILLFGLSVCFPNFSFCQLQVTANGNASQLAQSLAGSGVIISNSTINCAAGASGTFNGTATNLNIASGVLLTTGQVTDAVGPNNLPSAGTDNLVMFSDPNLTAIEPLATYDACILEFDAVPSCSTLAFTFSFGSEEYLEFVNAGYNDAFGIFVTGPNPSGPAYTGYNVALIPATTIPVSIDNVNSTVNSSYYINNETPPGQTIQYDGFTKPIAVSLNVSPCASYHFKLAIADAGDGIYDSGVFFALQSLACNPPPIILTNATTPSTCTANNGTATVNASGGVPPYTYSWNTTPPQTSPTASGLAPGTYIVTVYDATGCFYNKDTAVVLGSGGFNATSSQINETCFGSNNASATASPSGGTPPYTFAWSTTPPQTGPTITGVPAGSYTCQISDATGCVQSVTLTITQPSAVTGSITNTTNVSCFGGNNGAATASGSGGTGTITYSWNTTPTQSSPTASNLIAGSYVVTISDANHCTVTQNATITQPQGMTISTTSTPASCGLNDGTATVSSSGGAAPHTYLWLTTPVQTSPIATGLAFGVYTIIVTDANGCTQQQSISVLGGVPPVADFTFNPDVVSLLDPTVVFVDLSSGSPSLWYWTFDDVLSGTDNNSQTQNPFHTFTDTGTYCITLAISNVSGSCRDTIVKCLKVEAPYTFYIPNSFTPNFDSWNEMFLGYGTNIKDFHILIFDRWGNKVFESYDITKGWNGKVKATGKLVEEDVYVWKVDIVDIYNKQHRYIGHVSVLR